MAKKPRSEFQAPQLDAATPLASADGVARYLNCSKRTVHKLARSGEIPAKRLGKVLRFDLAEVVAAVRAKTFKPEG